MSIIDLDWHKKSSPAWDNPELKGLDVDGARYNSLEFMNKEWAYMWPKVWLLLGREDEIPEPGDYQMEEFGRESFLMIRQNNNTPFSKSHSIKTDSALSDQYPQDYPLKPASLSLGANTRDGNSGGKRNYVYEVHST